MGYFAIGASAFRVLLTIPGKKLSSGSARNYVIPPSDLEQLRPGAGGAAPALRSRPAEELRPPPPLSGGFQRIKGNGGRIHVSSHRTFERSAGTKTQTH